MNVYISHGANNGDWFAVTASGSDDPRAQVKSLLAAGRRVYCIEAYYPNSLDRTEVEYLVGL